jgi:hypothetical protein
MQLLNLSNQGDDCMSVLAVKTKVEDMEIGDMIPCRYKASSGSAGIFSELGTCTAHDIPVTGTATPDGLFNFIKVDKGLLIADRVIQHSISWDTLNSSKYIQGKIFTQDITSGTVMEFSSCWGGYSGNNVFSTTEEWHPASGITNGDITINLPSPVTITDFSFTSRGASYVPSSCELFSLDNETTIMPLTRVVNGTTSVYKLEKPIQIQLLKIKVYNSYYFTINNLKFSVLDINLYSSILRSLTGGNAYLGTDGKASLTDKGLGAWPVNNEWDKYIVNSDLGGKIVAGDDNVWHWNSVVFWCQDTPINGCLRQDNYSGSGSSTWKIQRGAVSPLYVSQNPSTQMHSVQGFRPVLEYPEDSRCTNIWY